MKKPNPIEEGVDEALRDILRDARQVASKEAVDKMVDVVDRYRLIVPMGKAQMTAGLMPAVIYALAAMATSLTRNSFRVYEHHGNPQEELRRQTEDVLVAAMKKAVHDGLKDGLDIGDEAAGKAGEA